jgi:hypothetical protein
MVALSTEGTDSSGLSSTALGPQALGTPPYEPVVMTTSTVRWITVPEPEPEPPAKVEPPAAASTPKPAIEIEVEIAQVIETEALATEAESATEPETEIPWELPSTPIETETETETGSIEVLTPAPLPVPQTVQEPQLLPLLPATSPVTEPARPIESATEALPVPKGKAPVPPGASASTTPLTPPPPVVSLPPNAVLAYEVQGNAKGFNYSAGGSLTWRRNGSSYEVQQEISVFLLGTFIQKSTGQVTPKGLAPERFSDSRRGKEKAASFEYAAGRIRFSNNAPDAPLLPGAQDQLSATLQLAGLLSAQPNLPTGHVLNLPVSSTGYSEVWHFEIGPLKTLTLPAGEIEARLLTRGPRKAQGKTVQLWLAPSLGYLPVRMRLSEHDGDFLDQLLSEMPEFKPANPVQDVQDVQQAN